MALLRKNPAGQTEVSAKAHALPPRARSLLIMVDGKRSMSDLRAMLGPQVDEAAELLLREGLIEAPSSTRPGALETMPGALAEQAAVPVPIDWQQMRQDAARAVTSAMGPMGDDLALRLERCKSEDELRVAMKRAADLLDIATSQAHAAEFRRRFERMLNPG